MRDVGGTRKLFQRAVQSAILAETEQGKLGKKVPGSDPVIHVRGRAGFVHVTRRDQTTIEARVKGIISYEEDYPVEFRLEHGTYVIQGRSVHPSLPVAADPSLGGGSGDIDSLIALGLVPLAMKTPASPHAKDDEFNGTTIDAKWTQRGPAGTPFATWSQPGDGGLYFSMPIKSDYGFDVLTQTAPSGDFTMTVAVRAITGARVTHNFPASLAVLETDHTNDFYAFGQKPINGGDLQVTRGTNLDTFASNPATVTMAPAQKVYYRFRRASAVWFFEWSTDCNHWVEAYTVSEPWTIGNIGVGGATESNAWPVGAVYDWVRFDWALGD